MTSEPAWRSSHLVPNRLRRLCNIDHSRNKHLPADRRRCHGGPSRARIGASAMTKTCTRAIVTGQSRPGGPADRALLTPASKGPPGGAILVLSSTPVGAAEPKLTFQPSGARMPPAVQAEVGAGGRVVGPEALLAICDLASTGVGRNGDIPLVIARRVSIAGIAVVPVGAARHQEPHRR